MIKKRSISKIMHSIIILCFLFGIVIGGQPYLKYLQQGTFLFHIINYFSYFTILSNLVLAISSLFHLIDIKPKNIYIKALYLNSTVCIMITSIIFNIFLRAHYHPHNTLENLSSEISHTINPLLALICYLFLDPKIRLTKKIVRIAITPPLLYTAYIFIRGYFTGFYPYYFVNIQSVGILTSSLFVISTIILFLFLSGIIALIEYNTDREYL